LIIVENWILSHCGPYFLNLNIPTIKKSINSDEIDRILDISSSIYNQKFHLLTSSDFMSTASHYANFGLYRESVLYSQMAIESFIRSLFLQFLLLESISIEKAEEQLVEIPFITIVKKELHIRLGGNWDINNYNIPPGCWYNSCYKIRNRIIHSGHRPSIDEAKSSFISASQFIDYIIEQLFNNKRKYPTIIKYFNRKS